MKIYYINYIGEERGELEVFTNKAKAQKRYAELKKDKTIEQVFDMEEALFPISAQGIVSAIEFGANTVWK